jgi:hypothetical protein
MAEQMMENAEQSMRQGETGRGASSARDAAQRLRSVREGLEATQEALRQAGHAVPGAADGRRPRLDGQPGESVDEVVMPDPDEFVGPESLRRLLLEGASSEVPGRYRPLHGSYYQELAR